MGPESKDIKDKDASTDDESNQDRQYSLRKSDSNEDFKYNNDGNYSNEEYNNADDNNTTSNDKGLEDKDIEASGSTTTVIEVISNDNDSESIQPLGVPVYKL